MSELKLCPFCGSKPFITPRINGDSLVFGIICANCGCESPKGITDKKAREWWNKRSKAQAVPQWISVSERLPEYGANVLIVVDGETEAENQVFEFKIGKWASSGFFESNKDDGRYYYVREVEYWAPLPAAPEQNK